MVPPAGRNPVNQLARLPSAQLPGTSFVLLAGHIRCQETQQACFCTDECATAAERTAGAPSLALRRILVKVPWEKLLLDECNQVRFMLHVLSLRGASSCPLASKKWEQFCCLQALPPDSCSHKRVWEVMKTLVDPDVSHDDVSLCLRKEAANSFGIMAPVGEYVRLLSCCSLFVV